MRAVLTSLLAAALLLAAPESNAAAPAAPNVTVGADIKQLAFDWDDAAGAAYYRLMYRVGSGAWKPLIDNIPASTTQAKVSVAVHLQSWSLLRYAVAACNADGCTNSAAVFPQNLMLDAIGYFKASNADPGDRFGNTVVLSEDGRTLVVSAPQEDSNATGVNGNQADNSSSCSGAVYVFRRLSSGWRQEAYIKADVNQPGLRFGNDLDNHRRALSINADGSLLAVGAAEKDLDGLSHAGAVYLYQRSPSGNWSLAATLQAPTPTALDRFGFSVDLSADGRTLKVDGYAPWKASSGAPMFRSHIFIRPGSTWEYLVALAGVWDGDECENTRLSSDANYLVLICNNFPHELPHVATYSRSGNSWFPGFDVGPIQFQYEGPRVGFALDFDASHMAMQDTRSQLRPTVGVFQRPFGGSGVHSPSPADEDLSAPKNFGYAIALDRVANLLAVSDITALEGGAGVSPVSLPGATRRGAIYMWVRREIPDSPVPGATAFYLRSVVKSPNPDDGDEFARSLALCGSGTALAVGSEGEDSQARGFDGDRTDNSSPDSGAVYLY